MEHDKRLDYHLHKKALKGLLEVERYIRQSNLDEKLCDLIKIRASQLNGCAYCLAMHSREARSAGETEQRIYGLSVWKETPYYSERERAALKWTEALTHIDRKETSDELYKEMTIQFTEEELMTLTMAVIAINSWNRLAISFKTKVRE